MKVEKVPDSTYDMIGGLDQQIKEIKEVPLQCSFILFIYSMPLAYQLLQSYTLLDSFRLLNFRLSILNCLRALE